MGMTIEDFVQCLADSGLIPANEISKLNNRIAADTSLREAESLTFALIKEQLLTEYQAKAILRGDSDSLILGNYVILDKIGQGGMGRVFKAWHRRMKRIVALKTLPPETSQNAKAIRRFHQEVATAAQLVHRNIVTAYDADEVQGIHFLVMEFVDGDDLGAVVRKHGPFGWKDAIRSILDAARGLDYAHQKGIIHRDIKPRNLLLDNKGTVKLLDLGLARPRDLAAVPKDELTSVGALVGTADYLAPEQAVNVKQADERSDIYSLGVTLFYIATGTIPYPGETVLERLVAHRETPVPPLSKFRPGAPKELEKICAKMLAKNPADRYRSVRELIHDLEECLRCVYGDPFDASPIRLPSEAGGGKSDSRLEETKTLRHAGFAPRTRSPSPALIGWTLVGLVAVAGTAVLLHWLRSGPETPPKAGTVVAAGRAMQPLIVLGPSPRERFAEAFPRPPAPSTAFADQADAIARQQAWQQFLHLEAELTNSVGMQFQVIPPGICRAGSSEAELVSLREEAARDGLPAWYIELLSSESPDHDVEVIFPLCFATHEVTMGQYRAVLGQLPGDDDGAGGKLHGASDDLPVGMISWFDAIGFCNALSEREGLRPCYTRSGGKVTRNDGNGYRLPSEAEWEYAVRAGTLTRWHFGDNGAELSRFAVFRRSPDAGPAVVGSQQPNPWGLHDMYGNAWEWCEDAFAPDAYQSYVGQPPGLDSVAKLGRVVRGGCFTWAASICRSANRTYYAESHQGQSLGLRVVRELRNAP
jgi:serine/threonine protein kinase